ncbi:MAG: type II toxin-antitoxin system death-on-curing family toxin [Bdellovibrionales bacterium]|nr:type II toxin-antitoxin system death-on-curing family toxin [Massilia sp.]
MRSWRWVKPSLVYAVHDIQLARYGGVAGLRDKNAVESALARARQLATHGSPQPDAAALAASYAYGIVHNHGFSDGNKRTAWVTARVFLLDNGETLKYAQVEVMRPMRGVAAGNFDEKQLAEWLRCHWSHVTP